MINRWVGVGRLVKDPELRYTPSGVANCRFTLAVNRSFKSEGQPDADFIQIVAWRKIGENSANFLKKGSLAGVEGRIQTGSYEKDGVRVYTTEVVADSVQFLESRAVAEGRIGAPAQSDNGHGNTNGQPQSQTPQTGNGGQYPQYTQTGQNRGPNAEYVAPNQSNYTRVEDDPFSRGSGPIEVSDDDLPF